MTTHAVTRQVLDGYLILTISYLVVNVCFCLSQYGEYISLQFDSVENWNKCEWRKSFTSFVYVRQLNVIAFQFRMRNETREVLFVYLYKWKTTKLWQTSCALRFYYGFYYTYCCLPMRIYTPVHISATHISHTSLSNCHFYIFPFAS